MEFCWVLFRQSKWAFGEARCYSKSYGKSLVCYCKQLSYTILYPCVSIRVSYVHQPVTRQTSSFSGQKLACVQHESLGQPTQAMVPGNVNFCAQGAAKGLESKRRRSQVSTSITAIQKRPDPMYLKKSCKLPASGIQCNIHQAGSNSNESLSDFQPAARLRANRFGHVELQLIQELVSLGLRR